MTSSLFFMGRKKGELDSLQKMGITKRGQGCKGHPNSLANLKPFKKGEPPPAGAGRPPGSKDLRKLVLEILELTMDGESDALKAMIELLPDAQRNKIQTLGQYMIFGQAVSAIEGNSAAFNAVMDRGYGREVQKVAPTDAEGETLQVQSVLILPQLPTQNDDNERTADQES